MHHTCARKRGRNALEFVAERDGLLGHVSQEDHHLWQWEVLGRAGVAGGSSRGGTSGGTRDDGGPHIGEVSEDATHRSHADAACEERDTVHALAQHERTEGALHLHLGARE